MMSIKTYIERKIGQSFEDKTYIPDNESRVYSFQDVLDMINEDERFRGWATELRMLAAYTTWSLLNWQSPGTVIDENFFDQDDLFETSWMSSEQETFNRLKKKNAFRL